MTSRLPPPSTWLPGSLPDDNLVLHDWPLPVGGPIRGQVLLVYGLGEHAGNYTELADQLNHWGFAVRAYDQYGHGDSSGQRGDVPHVDRLMLDLATVIDDTRTLLDDRLPLILLGHGIGALVAARLVGQKLRRVDGLGRVNTNGDGDDCARKSPTWRSRPNNSLPLNTACPGSVATSA